jgi:hypothetical protein
MLETGLSGLMSGGGKRGGAMRQRSRPSSTLPVPTVTMRVLFVFIVLEHRRREVLHPNVTEHPTAAWTSQQLVEVFPDRDAPSTTTLSIDKT